MGALDKMHARSGATQQAYFDASKEREDDVRTVPIGERSAEELIEEQERLRLKDLAATPEEKEAKQESEDLSRELGEGWWTTLTRKHRTDPDEVLPSGPSDPIPGGQGAQDREGRRLEGMRRQTAESYYPAIPRGRRGGGGSR